MSSRASSRTAVEKFEIRTVMECEAVHGVCANCYGRNLASGRLVETR